MRIIKIKLKNKCNLIFKTNKLNKLKDHLNKKNL